MRAEETKAVSVLISGGASETSNFSLHERDLKAMGEFLPSASVFNAGGLGSPVVTIKDDGYFDRDSLGYIRLSPSTLKHPAATLPNIQSHFSSLSETSAKGINVFFGDHGGPDGVQLWNEGALSANALSTEYKKIPAETTLRSIHLHCYAGAALVDPHRRFPPRDLKPFLEAHYPKNRCGYAMSPHYEVGDYFGWGEDASLDAILKKEKPANLKEFKAAIGKQKRAVSAGFLTSDYLVEDLRKWICRELNLGTAVPERASATHGEGGGRERGVVDSPCGPHSKETLALKAESLRADRLYGQLQGVLHDLAAPMAILDLERYKKEALALEQKKLGKIPDPDEIEKQAEEWGTQIWDGYYKAVGELEKLKAQVAIRYPKGDIPEEVSKLIDRHVSDLKSDEFRIFETHIFKVTNFDLSRGGSSSFPLSNVFQKPEFQKFLRAEENAERFGELVSFMDSPGRKGLGLGKIEEKVSEILDRSRAANKSQLVRNQKADRAFVEAKLALPQFKFLKERLDALDACESSAFSG